MINNYKALSIGTFLLLIAALINLPFPHRYPLGEKVLTMLHIPTRISSEGVGGLFNGFHVIFLFSMAFLIGGLYFLGKSVERNKVRIVLSALLIVSIVPNLLLNMYLTNFSSGIHAVTYQSESSNCTYERIDGQKGQATCELQFGNYSDQPVEFDVMFDDRTDRMVLFNDGAPYEMKLAANEWKTITIQTDFDTSETDYEMNNGQANGMKIILRSGTKKREL